MGHCLQCGRTETEDLAIDGPRCDFCAPDRSFAEHRCSLCGDWTLIPKGSTVASWYLCDACEGTDEAAKAGFIH